MNPLRDVELEGCGVDGTLWLHSMPGRYEDLPEFLAAARRERIDRILCLASEEEVAVKSPDYVDWLVRPDREIRVIIYPVADYRAPGDEEGFRATLSEFADLLHGGHNALIHCAGGVGRTGTAAVCLLGELGLGLDDATARVREVRSGPENPEQIEFVRNFFQA